jgi:hypothetical protein
MGLRIAVDNSAQIKRDERRFRATQIVRGLSWRMAEDVERLRELGFTERAIRESLRAVIRYAMDPEVYCSGDSAA